MDLQFEWNKSKAKNNFAKHAVSFELAKRVFDDPFAVEFPDDREDYDDERFAIIGMVGGRILYVIYAERKNIIGAPTNMSRKSTSKKTLKGFRPMTPAAVERAALADPDARPLTRTGTKRMKRTPQVKIIRRALRMTQEEFAARYRIPLGTLRDWEQGRAIPDQPARAYLTVIARSPHEVQQALGN